MGVLNFSSNSSKLNVEGLASAPASANAVFSLGSCCPSAALSAPKLSVEGTLETCFRSEAIDGSELLPSSHHCNCPIELDPVHANLVLNFSSNSSKLNVEGLASAPAS